MTQCRQHVDLCGNIVERSKKHVRLVWSHGHEWHFAEVQFGDIRRWRQLAVDI